MSKLVLYGATGSIAVRAARAAIDAPASGAWTPDNLNATELLEADDVTLYGHGWEDVRILAQFAGTVGGSESVTVQALRAVWQATAPGRFWIPVGDPFSLTPNVDNDLVLVDGADMAFRITALTLDGGDSVTLIATGGQRARDVK